MLVHVHIYVREEFLLQLEKCPLGVVTATSRQSAICQTATWMVQILIDMHMFFGTLMRNVATARQAHGR